MGAQQSPEPAGGVGIWLMVKGSWLMVTGEWLGVLWNQAEGERMGFSCWKISRRFLVSPRALVKR